MLRQCLALLIGDIAATEEGLDHLIGHQGASVELLRTLGDTAHGFIIAVSIISHEGLTILEHGLGGLLGVIEGVVFFAQVVLDDADLGAQALSVLRYWRRSFPVIGQFVLPAGSHPRWRH